MNCMQIEENRIYTFTNFHGKTDKFTKFYNILSAKNYVSNFISLIIIGA